MATKKDKDKLVSATFLIPSSMKAQVKQNAKDQDVSSGHYIRQILKNWFTKRPKSQQESQ